MKIEINDKTVREMAGRLREGSGKDLKHCASIEEITRILGFPNWDTLSGLLKRGQQAVFKVEKPLTLYVDAYACDEYGESPTWAKLTIDQAFVDTLLKMQALCRTNKLHLVAEHCTVDAWQEDDNYRMRGDELQVTEDNWWVRAHPKHVDYYCETRMIGVNELLQVLNGCSPPASKYWLQRKDVLIYDSSGAASATLDYLVEEGELDELYAD